MPLINPAATFSQDQFPLGERAGATIPRPAGPSSPQFGKANAAYFEFKTPVNFAEGRGVHDHADAELRSSTRSASSACR